MADDQTTTLKDALRSFSNTLETLANQANAITKSLTPPNVTITDGGSGYDKSPPPVAEMVERCARAVWENNVRKWGTNIRWEQAPLDTQIRCCDDIQFIINAMRVPTSEMIRVAECLKMTRHNANRISSVADIYRWMIAAALGEITKSEE